MNLPEGRKEQILLLEYTSASRETSWKPRNFCLCYWSLVFISYLKSWESAHNSSLLWLYISYCFTWWLSGKESACNTEDKGSIPGLERSPREGSGNPLLYFCLGNPMDREAQQAIVHGVEKSQAWLSMHTLLYQQQVPWKESQRYPLVVLPHSMLESHLAYLAQLAGPFLFCLPFWESLFLESCWMIS